MNKKLLRYNVYSYIQFLLIQLSIPKLITAVSDCNYFNTIVFSVIIFSTLKTLIETQENFMKYYPHFEDKWLKLF